MSDSYRTRPASERNYHKGPKASTVTERFWSKVEKTAGCWLWRGCVMTATNSGVFKFQGKNTQAHRVAWILSKEIDPGALQIVHTCGNTLCMNPDHLTTVTPESRLWQRVDMNPDGCWLFKGAAKSRYGRIQFRDRLDLAHRVAWILTYGEIPDGMWVLHKCDVPKCVRPDHLFLGTPKENVEDMMAKGRHYHGDEQWTRKHPERVPRGEEMVTSKLTEGQVRRIRDRFAAGGVSKNRLAREEGVSHPTIRRIIARKVWKHI